MNGVEYIEKSERYAMPDRYTYSDIIANPDKDHVEGEVYWPSQKKQCRPWRFDAKYFVSAEQYDALQSKQKKEEKDAAERTDSQQEIQY